MHVCSKLAYIRSVSYPNHYWRHPVCRGHRALGKGFAECRSWQKALGKKINGKEALCRGPFVGHSANPFPSANGGTRQRKAAVNGAAPLTAPLPSAAKTFFIYFFKNSLPSAAAVRHSAKTFFIFLKKLFAECLPSLALGKDFLLFFKKIFAECNVLPLGKVSQLCRVP